MKTVLINNEQIKGQLPKATEPIALGALSLNSVWHMSYNQFSDKQTGGGNS